MPKYRLEYFDIEGRAELARLMFAAAKVDYEDDRVAFEDWPQRKLGTPFGQLPVLHIDGKPLTQSGAIYRYLATEYGFNGTNSLEAAYIEMIHDTLVDIFSKIPAYEKDENVKRSKTREVVKDVIVPTLEKMEKKFAEQDKNFLIGQKLSYADISMANMLMVCEAANAPIGHLTCLMQLKERVKETDGIKQYLATRPVRPTGLDMSPGKATQF